MKQALKQLVFTLLNFLPRNRSRASILMYHSVGENTAEFTVSPRMFERQLRYLVAHRYCILPLSALVERLRAGEPLSSCISLTFDDGYQDLYTVVFPLIKELNIHISIFLSTGYVGGTFSTSRGDTLSILSWEQVREMHGSGLVEFLPHGCMHHSLPTLSADEAKAEIKAGLADLEDKLGSVPRVYAYAKGKYSNETIHLLEDENFIAAVTVRPGYLSAKSPLFELPRNHMDAQTSFAEFKSRVSGSAKWYERLK